MRRTPRTAVAACLVGTCVIGAAASMPAATAGSTPAKVSTTQTLAPGLTLTRITDPAGPWILRVLTVDPSQPLTLDVATAGGSMGTYAKPSAVGESHDALAAINGDFTVAPGRPLHAFAEDGSLKAMGSQNGVSFAISQDEQDAFIGSPPVTVRARNLGSKRTFALAGWNSGRPKGGDVVAFTPYGGSVEAPPDDACSVRLKPVSRPVFGTGGVGLVRDYSVTRRRCASAAMGVRTRTIVLSSNQTGKGSAALRELRTRDRVRLTWSYGWAGVMDAIGGMPQLVRNGRNVAHTCASYFCSRNPRTAIGVTAAGDVLLVTVDGRKPSSVGMTLIQLAGTMKDLGAVSAVNLDGGGGSAMWVDGQGIVNDPSDRGGERPVTNVLLVLGGSDDAEPRMRSWATGPSLLDPSSPFAPPTSDAEARHALALAMGDPGSTGGLLAAYDRARA